MAWKQAPVRTRYLAIGWVDIYDDGAAELHQHYYLPNGDIEYHRSASPPLTLQSLIRYIRTLFHNWRQRRHREWWSYG